MHHGSEIWVSALDQLIAARNYYTLFEMYLTDSECWGLIITSEITLYVYSYSSIKFHVTREILFTLCK